MSYKLKILNGVLKLKTFSDVVLNILGIKDLGTQTGEVTDGYVDWSMQQITKTTAEWNASTYILLKGQAGVEDTGTTTFKLKVGDGISTWQQLGYISGGGANNFPEHLYLTVVNGTGSNLLATEYKVVKVEAAQGQRLQVDLAQANNDANSADTIGVVYENINNNQTGKIVVVGEITGINTTGSLQGEDWNDGDVIYLSPTTAGSITNVKPSAPNHLVVLGYVVYAHQNNGKIYVKIDNGYELSELHDVYAPSPSNNQSIFWNSTTSRYENKTIASALGYTPENSASKGVANGYAPLGSDIKVDASYLPSYVSDVLEYANLAAFPVTGTSNKIYVALDTNKVYRWSGSIYVEVSANSGVWGAITGTLANQTDLKSALDSKQSLLPFNPYYVLSKSNAYLDVTGTTNETIFTSILIPSGTIQSNDKINIEAKPLPIGNTAKTFRVYINTSASLTGATLIGFTSNIATTMQIFKRQIVMQNSTSTAFMYPNSVSFTNYETYSANASSIIALTSNFAVNQYLIFTGQNGNTTDTLRLYDYLITIIR